MLYYCEFTWNRTTTQEAMDRRLVGLLGSNPVGSKIHGYYDLVGGAAGFLILETDNPEDVAAMMIPYSDLLHWDVRSIIARDLEASIAEAKADVAQGNG